METILNQETIAALSQVGAVTAILLIILALVWLASRLIGPFTTMSSMLRDSQRQIVLSIDKMTEVVEENTRTFKNLGALLETSGKDAKLTRESLGALQRELKEASRMMNAGVVVANASGEFIYASPQALRVLGWASDQLPGGANEQKAPVLTPLGTVLGAEEWPLKAVIRTGRPIENIPLQAYDYDLKDYKWIMLSAYPCIRSQETGELPPDWVTIKMYELGRMEHL